MNSVFSLFNLLILLIHCIPSVSDDDVIDYSVKPEFYDPNLDDKDQLWVQKRKKGQYSDAVLSCPACFTTLCLECQRYMNKPTYESFFKQICNVDY